MKRFEMRGRGLDPATPQPSLILLYSGYQIKCTRRVESHLVCHSPFFFRLRRKDWKSEPLSIIYSTGHFNYLLNIDISYNLLLKTLKKE